MGVVKVPVLCLLLLIPLLALPGSEGKTCTFFSKTYYNFYCVNDKCVEHCNNEGFDEGQCNMISFKPVMLVCFCKKPC